MTFAELLTETSKRGLQLRRRGGEVVVRGNQAQLDSAYIQALRIHKEGLIQRLRTEEEQPWLSTRAITPEMFPLMQLTSPQLDALVSHVPDGAANVQDIYPLAPLQEGILFHYLMNTETDPYVLSRIL